MSLLSGGSRHCETLLLVQSTGGFPLMYFRVLQDGPAGVPDLCWSLPLGKTTAVFHPNRQEQAVSRAAWGVKKKTNVEGNHTQFQKQLIELAQNHGTQSTCCCLKHP